MVSMLALIGVKLKTCKIGICRFSAKHTSLMRKSKDSDWLVRNQDNVSKCSDMSTRGQCFSDLAL
jgi:hypothetical protein